MASPTGFDLAAFKSTTLPHFLAFPLLCMISLQAHLSIFALSRDDLSRCIRVHTCTFGTTCVFLLSHRAFSIFSIFYSPHGHNCFSLPLLLYISYPNVNILSPFAAFRVLPCIFFFAFCKKKCAEKTQPKAQWSMLYTPVYLSMAHKRAMGRPRGQHSTARVRGAMSLIVQSGTLSPSRPFHYPSQLYGAAAGPDYLIMNKVQIGTPVTTCTAYRTELS